MREESMTIILLISIFGLVICPCDVGSVAPRRAVSSAVKIPGVNCYVDADTQLVLCPMDWGLWKPVSEAVSYVGDSVGGLLLSLL